MKVVQLATAFITIAAAGAEEVVKEEWASAKDEVSYNIIVVGSGARHVLFMKCRQLTHFVFICCVL